MLDPIMSAAEWFDDWRDWIEWVNTHDPLDVHRLRRQKTADGRKRLAVSELVLHHGELAGRAESWTCLCNAYCQQYGLTEDCYDRLPADAKARYARIPDSPVWGHARGLWVRQEALVYLQERLQHQASAPLRWRTGLNCPRCGLHYSGRPGGQSSQWLGDARVGESSEGFILYRCSACGCEFVFEWGSSMLLRDAVKREREEIERVISVFALGRPVRWHDRLLWRLLNRNAP